MKKILAIVAVVVVLLGIGAVVATAAIPGTDGLIHGCYKNSNGALIVIDESASCPTGYTALNWQQSQDPVTASHQQVATITNDQTIQGGEGFGSETQCPSGTVVTGGGYAVNDTADVRVVVSGPGGNGWGVRIFAPNGPVTFTLFVYADCLTLN